MRVLAGELLPFGAPRVHSAWHMVAILSVKGNCFHARNYVASIPDNAAIYRSLHIAMIVLRSVIQRSQAWYPTTRLSSIGIEGRSWSGCWTAAAYALTPAYMLWNPMLACTDYIDEQADFLTSRLTSLEERIDGVEDQLEIELDHRRNELVALDLIVGAVMGAFAFVSMIGGVFGMNMKNGYEDSKVSTLPACLATSICSCKVASHKMGSCFKRAWVIVVLHQY